jgi:hypothetical protein
MPLNSLTAPGFVIAVLNIFAIVMDFALFSSYFASTPADDRATIVVPHNGHDNNNSEQVSRVAPLNLALFVMTHCDHERPDT